MQSFWCLQCCAVIVQLVCAAIWSWLGGEYSSAGLYACSSCGTRADCNRYALTHGKLPRNPFTATHVCCTCRVFGPHSLKSIAAAVLQRTLAQKLDSLEAAQAEQSCSASTSTGSCTKGPAQGQHACCSKQQVCVQASCSNGSEAGVSAAVLSHMSASSADVDLIVVQADVSPDSSRATSPVDGSCAASPSGCGSPASGRGKAVTFTPPASQEKGDEYVAGTDVSASCAGVGPPLRHALTHASSSGWYDELCSVCWESEVTAVMEPCMHAMCLGCARQLVGCSGTAPPACPLCRANISGFAAVPEDVRQQAGKRKKCLLAGSGI